MRTQTRIGLAFGLTLTAALLAYSPQAEAGNGTWTADADGNWSTTGNWSGGNIADGTGSTGDFSTINITGYRTVTLDSARTNGYLRFADTTPSHHWVLKDGPLTLDVTSGKPDIWVNGVSPAYGATVWAACRLAGTNGFTVSGPGGGHFWLRGHNVNQSSISGGITVNRGVTLGFIYRWDDFIPLYGSIDNMVNPDNSLTLNGGAFFFYGQGTARSQTFNNGLRFGGASSCNSGGYGPNSQLYLNGITRSSNGVIRFANVNDGSGSSYTYTTTPNNGTGLLGPYAFYKREYTAWSYARGNDPSPIDAYPAGSAVSPDSFTSATANYDFSSGATLTANRTAYTARCTATGAATIGLNGNTLTLNGLLNAGGATSGLLTINGSGSLVIGSENELVIAAAANAITIGAPITNGASAGTLTKAGASTLTLTNVCTYTGDTWVHEGTLVLADNAGLKFVIGASNVNNRIRGNGTVTLNGDFYFDLTTAGTSDGDRWTIVDSTLTTNYTATFTVNGFTDLGNGSWRRVANGVRYVFAKSTGVLTATPLAPPTVAVTNATAIGVGTATLNAWLVSQSADAMAICWGTNDCGTSSTGAWPNVVNFGATDDPALVSTNLTGLIYGQRYWYRAYATNAIGGAWSPTATNFLTLAPAGGVAATGGTVTN